jgi:4Fe-4S ferredoxin
MPPFSASALPRPPSGCRQSPGLFLPRIDRNRCEGKGPCVDACPTQVLAMGVVQGQARAGLSLIGRVKAFAHGYRQVFVVSPGRCEACGDCVRVCPEQAITLARAARPHTEGERP